MYFPRQIQATILLRHSEFSQFSLRVIAVLNIIQSARSSRYNFASSLEFSQFSSKQKWQRRCQLSLLEVTLHCGHVEKYVNRKMRKGDILLEIKQTSNVPMGDAAISWHAAAYCKSVQDEC
jgi:hypothetical protein